METQVVVNRFYPEEFRRKADSEKYLSKGTCEVHLLLGEIAMDVKNITYRIDHEGKILLKAPFRIHSNKRAGIKPRLVPSIVFKEPGVWGQIEEAIKSELSKKALALPRRECLQLDLFEQTSITY